MLSALYSLVAVEVRSWQREGRPVYQSPTGFLFGDRYLFSQLAKKINSEPICDKT
jgi:hypothetical protein